MRAPTVCPHDSSFRPIHRGIVGETDSPLSMPFCAQMAKSRTTAKTRDLFEESAPRRAAAAGAGKPAEAGYTARHIEVLEGLEPVRRRPGMYIGGTDEKALHHLFA